MLYTQEGLVAEGESVRRAQASVCGQRQRNPGFRGKLLVFSFVQRTNRAKRPWSKKNLGSESLKETNISERLRRSGKVLKRFRIYYLLFENLEN